MRVRSPHSWADVPMRRNGGANATKYEFSRDSSPLRLARCHRIICRASALPTGQPTTQERHSMRARLAFAIALAQLTFSGVATLQAQSSQGRGVPWRDAFGGLSVDGYFLLQAAPGVQL